MTTYLPYRANTYCSLGHLIDGQFADTYLQQAGLIFCRGSVRLAGIYRPDIGTVVDFAYTRDNVTAARIPRRLRVLSSFADPFTKVTTVQLGCKLSLLQENREIDAKVTPLDSDPTLPAGWEEYVAPPVTARAVAAECLSKLGITAAAALPLVNRFTADFIDLSAGYVEVLAKLLESETYVGWLNEDEELEVRSLIGPGIAMGPVINNTNVFTLSPIGVGSLPAEVVTVSYSPLSLADVTVDSSSSLAEQANILKSITYGFPVLLYIPWESTATGNSGVIVVEYVPLLESETEYDDERRPISTITTTLKPYSAANASFVSQILSVVAITDFDTRVKTESKTVTTYDENGRIKTETTTDTLSPMELAGSLGLNYIFDNGSNWVPPLVGDIITQRTITNYSYASTSVKREVQRYQNWTLTQTGQYFITSAYDTAEAAFAFFNSLNLPLVFTGAETNIGDTEPPVSELLGPAELAEKAFGTSSRDSEAVSEFVFGSSTAQRLATYSLPYTGDDYFTLSGSTWVRTDGAEAAKGRALNYGRVQNRLKLGNSQGVSLQIPVELLPTSPFDAIYLQADGLTGQYRANGMNWTFDQNGIIGQVDALFWLATGQTGTPGDIWFPMPPAVTVLPTTPTPTVNGSPAPANSASLPGGWNPAAPDLTTLFNTTLPTGVAPVFPSTLNVETGLEPFTETVPLEAITRSVLSVVDVPFSLVPQTASVSLVTRSVIEPTATEPSTAGDRLYLFPIDPLALIPL